MGVRSVANWVLVAARALAALLVPCSPAFADGPWLFDGNILVLDKTTGTTILSDTHTAQGGSVRIRLDGSVLGNYCDPGFEEMQFDWHFAGDIHQLSEGDAVSATVSAKFLGAKAPCNGDLAGSSTIWVWTGDAPLPDDLEKQTDDGRIYTTLEQHNVSATKEPQSVVDQAFVRVGQPHPEPPLAYLSVQVALRGGGNLWYVYMYRRADQPNPTTSSQPPTPPSAPPSSVEPPPSPTVSVSSELHVDRRGGDYDNFPVPSNDPQVCAAACAAATKCLAYTFVLPTGDQPGHCWLKSTIPPATPSDCCLSGIRTPAKFHADR